MKTTWNSIIAFVFAIAVGFLLGLPSCNAQQKKQYVNETAKPLKSNPANQPQEHIYVNRETDKNGNITRYDSVYTWSWKSTGTQSVFDWINPPYKPGTASYRSYVCPRPIPGSTGWISYQKSAFNCIRYVMELQMKALKALQQPFTVPVPKLYPAPQQERVPASNTGTTGIKTT